MGRVEEVTNVCLLEGKQTLVSPDGKVNAPEFAKASHEYKQAKKNTNKFKGKTSFK